MTTTMVTRPMPVHPHQRFGIGVIPIRGITLRCPTAQYRGNKLFSNERGMDNRAHLGDGRFCKPRWQVAVGVARRLADTSIGVVGILLERYGDKPKAGG
jgi:hypothetical protein